MRYEERDGEARRRLAARLSALRLRAFRSRAALARLDAAAATLLPTAAALCASVFCRRPGALTDALLVACLSFPLFFCLLIFRLRRRVPGTIDAARRLDARFPADAGVILTALDSRTAGAPSMMRETLLRAERLLAAAGALADDELADLFFCDDAAISRDSDSADSDDDSDSDPADRRRARLDAIPRRLRRAVARRALIQKTTRAAAALAIAAFIAAGLAPLARPLAPVRTHADTPTDVHEPGVSMDPGSSNEVPAPGTVGADANDAADADAPRRDLPDSDVNPADPGAAFALFAAELTRACALADALTDEIRGGAENDPAAYASAVALFHELDDVVGSSSGLIVRAGGAADASAATLRAFAANLAGGAGTKDAAGICRAAFTVRRAAELIRDLNAMRADAPDSCRALLTSGLTRWARGTTAEDCAAGRALAGQAAAAFAMRLTSEARAAAIMTASWEFADAAEDADACYDALLRESADALALRAGMTPTPGSARAAVPAFFADLDASRRGVAGLLTRYETLRALLAAPDAGEFLDFARRADDDEPALGVFRPAASAPDPADFTARRLALLAAAEREADAERWGRAATLLRAPTDALELLDSAEEPEAAEESAEKTPANVGALAFSLSFGAPDDDGESVGYAVAAAAIAAAPGTGRTNPAAGEQSAARKIDERRGSAADPDALRALDREAAIGEAAALDARADLSALRDQTALRGDSGGVISDAGSEPDAEFAGVGSARPDDSDVRRANEDGFRAELPADVRERLDRAERWTPDEDYLRRAREFRRRLRDVSRSHETP